MGVDEIGAGGFAAHFCAAGDAQFRAIFRTGGARDEFGAS